MKCSRGWKANGPLIYKASKLGINYPAFLDICLKNVSPSEWISRSKKLTEHHRYKTLIQASARVLVAWAERLLRDKHSTIQQLHCSSDDSFQYCTLFIYLVLVSFNILTHFNNVNFSFICGFSLNCSVGCLKSVGIEEKQNLVAFGIGLVWTMRGCVWWWWGGLRGGSEKLGCHDLSGPHGRQLF